MMTTMAVEGITIMADPSSRLCRLGRTILATALVGVLILGAAAVNAGPGPNTTTIPSTGQTLGIVISDPTGNPPIPVPIPPGTVEVKGNCTIGSVPGAPINVLYVIDVSGSTDNPGTVDANGDGVINAADDFNGDGEPGETLDGEIAGVLALNASIGNPANVRVGVVAFASGASAADVSPLAPNTGTITQFFASPPQVDLNTNLIPDINEVLRSLRSETPSGGTIAKFTPVGSGTLGNNTNFAAALTAMNSALTHFPAGTNIVFFLSDGESNAGSRCFQSPFPCSTALNAAVAAHTTINTVGVGSGADPTDLTYIAHYSNGGGSIGGSYFPATNPSQLTTILPSINPTGIATVVVDGVDVGIDSLGNFTRLITCSDLSPFSVTATCIASDAASTSVSADIGLQCYNLCGDGIVEQNVGEECDPPSVPPNGPTATCDAACQRVPRCGDGFVDAPEACDPPHLGSCSTICQLIACGNGVVDPGEQCDDGNLTNGDGCDSNCTSTGCGNGILTAGEQCDDGNTTSGDGCDSNCTPTGCGNGVVTAGELCDDGNLVNGDGCDSNCTPTGCGNGILTAGEQCDDGNTTSGDGCDANCTVTACGNGIVTSPEGCDDGNTVNGDGCDNNCTPTSCGNGIQTAGEQCDDGNTTSGDGCNADCTTGHCGDGQVNPGEQCDDGNTVDTDACRNDCTAPRCGDGIVDAGEECDLGTQNNDLGLCGTDCLRNPRYYCANPVAAYVRKAGFKHTAAGPTPQTFDNWQMKGDIIVASPPFDPASQNVTIALTQATDPDAPSSFQKTKNPADTVPFVAKGIGKWRFYDRKGIGWTKGFLRARDAHVKYILQGRAADIELDSGKLRIRQSLVIGNQCWEAVLSCTLKANGNLFRCRSTGLPF